MENYFAIKDLKVGYKTFEGEKEVLDIKNLTIHKGETFGIVGESGAGKTVLALTILKLLPAPPGVIKSGEILFQGGNLLAKSEREMQRVRGRKISMIFQDPMSTLNPVFTVGEQVARVIRNNRGCGKKEAAAGALEMLELVKLPDSARLMEKYPHELSGGQRQRIIIAMALSCGAEFLIADEPTRNLDVTIQAGILKLIAQLQKELQITVLFIANNLGLVSATCKRVGILHRGEIVEMGPVREIVGTPRHPYTVTLLQAIPRSKKDKLAAMQPLLRAGEGPVGGGCRYAGRCLEQDLRCREERPQLQAVEGTHLVACHCPLPGGVRQ